jgi:uncharacterized protein (UPF0335 family)
MTAIAMARKRLNMGPARELKDFVDHIIAKEIELKQITTELKGDVEDIYDEADDKGYDVKALKIAVRRRHESAKARAKRQETEALADVYSAAIGDLFGKPLDDLTRRRLDEQMKRPEGQEQQPGDDQQPHPDLPDEATERAEPAETPEEAHAKGRQARKDDLRIVDNPYHSSSPLRAAWDEGWCEEDGSDGMEVPAAWKRTKPPEDGDGKGGEGDDKKPPAPPGDGAAAGAPA